MNTIAVVTTIHQPTRAVEALSALLPDRVLIVADEKTPKDWGASGTRFLSVEAQAGTPFSWQPQANHYSRKNYGYLKAMLLGAECIYDTDDDNIPLDRWQVRSKLCSGHSPATSTDWCNVYRIFSSNERLWPRGLPLTRIADGSPTILESPREFCCPIQQGLADGDPDVDAFWRLACAAPAAFDRQGTVSLSPRVWCPFNSQSTWWWPEAFPLLYLPVTAPFRMTDIWRSFVAQRCLWASDLGRVAFHSPAEVEQVRNPHDLLADFVDEIPGYIHNAEIAHALGELKLDSDPSLKSTLANLCACYRLLHDKLGVVTRDELSSVDAWAEDVYRILSRPSWAR